MENPAVTVPAVQFAVEVTQDPTRLAAITAQWEELAAHAIEPNPMYEHWMLLPSLGACGVPASMACVLVWRRDLQHPDAAPTLAGLFPLERVRRFKGLPVTALSSWAHKSWMLCTPLVHADQARPCLNALLDWLENRGDASCVLELRLLPCDGAFQGVLADVLRERNAMVTAGSKFSRALLRREVDADRYLESMSRVGRKSMRRKEMRLSERGRLRRVAMQAGDDAARWIDEFLQLEASGWKGRRGTAMASSEASRRFAIETLMAAHRRSRLQIIGIDFDDRPIARCCNIVAGDGAYAYRTAYDEKFARFSPGVMAEIDSIRHFHALPGLKWMDSITDPDNITLNRLWKERRTMQTLVVGAGTWGELWVSMLPVMRWAKRRLARTRNAITRSALSKAGPVCR